MNTKKPKDMVMDMDMVMSTDTDTVMDMVMDTKRKVMVMVMDTDTVSSLRISIRKPLKVGINFLSSRIQIWLRTSRPI